VTPGGEVLRRAFDLWGLRIELGNYVITKESFGPQPDAGLKLTNNSTYWTNWTNWIVIS